MLLMSAPTDSGIMIRPGAEPVVWQKSLSDFYVEYQLVARLDDPGNRVAILSQLHANIQDAFNERGVQIMSPHFEGQPERKVFVPRTEWKGEGLSGPDA